MGRRTIAAIMLAAATAAVPILAADPPPLGRSRPLPGSLRQQRRLEHDLRFLHRHGAADLRQAEGIGKVQVQAQEETEGATETLGEPSQASSATQEEETTQEELEAVSVFSKRKPEPGSHEKNTRLRRR